MITIVSPDLERLAIGAAVFPKPLRASMRKELTVIGRTAATASKSRIKSMPAGGKTPYKGRSGLRADIAAAIKVSATANTAAGVGLSIKVAKTSALVEHRRFRVAQLLDKGKPFPHKVYGRWTKPLTMVTNFSYFDKVIEGMAPEVLAAANTAIRVATLASIPNVR